MCPLFRQPLLHHGRLSRKTGVVVWVPSDRLARGVACAPPLFRAKISRNTVDISTLVKVRANR